MRGSAATPRAGFSLVELIAVIVIISVLASIAVGRFRSMKEKTIVAAMRSDLHNLMTAQEVYFLDNGERYAPEVSLLLPAYHTSPGVFIVLQDVTASTWSASATANGTTVSCDVSRSSGKTTDGSPECQ